MNIEHIALWVNNIEKIKNFYIKYFNAVSGKKYTNKTKNFESYFLTFENGARLEIMTDTNLQENNNKIKRKPGYSHIAISTKSKNNVDELTQKLKNDGFTVKSGPRTTGDGYYESCVLDPEGNIIEITV